MRKHLIPCHHNVHSDRWPDCRGIIGFSDHLHLHSMPKRVISCPNSGLWLTLRARRHAYQLGLASCSCRASHRWRRVRNIGPRLRRRPTRPASRCTTASAAAARPASLCRVRYAILDASHVWRLIRQAMPTSKFSVGRPASLRGLRSRARSWPAPLPSRSAMLSWPAASSWKRRCDPECALFRCYSL